jgi:hypothetical protein
MEKNPQITILGSWVKIYETGKVVRLPCSDDTIRAHMFFSSPFAHPTVLFRKNIVLQYSGGYDLSMAPAEDYDLWSRLADYDDIVFANIPEVMLRYRIHPGKDREIYRKDQLEMTNIVRVRQLIRFGEEYVNKKMYALFFGSYRAHNAIELKKCGEWVIKINHVNKTKNIYSHIYFEELLDKYWLSACLNAYPWVLQSLLIYCHFLSKRKNCKFFSYILHSFIFRNMDCIKAFWRRYINVLI